MQSKTTRAFRTISEAAEELDLQAHVLRFWESKFSQINPIKRAGGRRLYRAEDIDLLRGIKILLHEEKHPIKDVQKIIRLKGASQVVELGQSVQRAAQPKTVKETVLVPERIVAQKRAPAPVKTAAAPAAAPITPAPSPPQYVPPPQPVAAAPVVVKPQLDVSKLKVILTRLEGLREKWDGLDLKGSQ